MRLNNKPLSLTLFALIMSVVNLVLYNIPFFRFVAQHSSLTGVASVLLFAGLSLLMVAVNFLACYLLLFLLRYVGRVIVAISHILNATCVYFIAVYNVFIDGSMLGNVFNTRYSEASGFFSPMLWLTILLLGVLPAIYVLWQKIDYGSWKHFGIAGGVSLGVSVLCIAVNYNQFLWIGEWDTELGGLLMPWSYTVNSGRLLAQHRQATQEEILLPDGSFTDDDKTAVVLVIGESARRANFSLYGYQRETNPLLGKRTDIHALPARACATYTTAGVKAMLEYKDQSTLYEILPNYLFRMGADVVWRTNNWGEPPIHIAEYQAMSDLRKRYPQAAEPRYDALLMEGLKERITQSEKNKVFVVLHTTTSHGPSYNAYYPESFNVFTPICDNVEEGRKSLDKLVNTYDNSIVYTDYLINNLIDTLQTMSDWKCAVLFVSDHGESLGENNLFMHGLPVSMAPKEQYEIPFIVWTSPGFRTLKPITEEIEQHSVYHSVLNLMSFDSPVYDCQKDIFLPQPRDN